MTAHFYKMPTKSSRPTENWTANGTVWDKNDNEWDVTVFGNYMYQAPQTYGPPENCHDGCDEYDVTRVIVHTSGGGCYEKDFDRFPEETQDQILQLLMSGGEPKYINDCDD
jgi:hypothetical protein